MSFLLRLFSPTLRTQWQVIQLGPSVLPSRIVLVENRDETFAVGWLQQVSHFVDDHVFEQSFRLFDQLGVQSDVPSAMIAASPLGFHALEEIAVDLYTKFRFPLAGSVSVCFSLDRRI